MKVWVLMERYITKMDGDARGGAALSIKSVTGKPIKLIGMSEKLDGGLENFSIRLVWLVVF